MRTVLAVAKRAIRDKRIPPNGPRIASATSRKGASEVAIVAASKILTIAIATKQYKTVVIIIE
jgi:hypothetical protein